MENLVPVSRVDKFRMQDAGLPCKLWRSPELFLNQSGLDLIDHRSSLFSTPRFYLSSFHLLRSSQKLNMNIWFIVFTAKKLKHLCEINVFFLRNVHSLIHPWLLKNIRRANIFMMETSSVNIITLSSMPALIPLRFPGSKDIYTSYEGPLDLVKTETTINKNTQSTQENTPFISNKEKQAQCSETWTKKILYWNAKCLSNQN